MVLEIEELRAKRRHLERLTLDGEALLAGHAIWLGGNPAPELADVRRKITEAEAQTELLRAESVRHAESSSTLRPRIDGLRGLLSEAFLLDPPDHVDRLQSIGRRLPIGSSRRRSRWRGCRPLRRSSTRISSVLRSRPLEDDELASLCLARVDELRRPARALGCRHRCTGICPRKCRGAQLVRGTATIGR